MSWKTFNTFLWLFHIYDIMLAICESIYLDSPSWAPHQVGFNRAPALHRVGPPTPGGHDIRGSMEIKVKKCLLIYMGCFLTVLFLNKLLTYCWLYLLLCCFFFGRCMKGWSMLISWCLWTNHWWTNRWSWLDWSSSGGIEHVVLHLLPWHLYTHSILLLMFSGVHLWVVTPSFPAIWCELWAWVRWQNEKAHTHCLPKNPSDFYFPGLHKTHNEKVKGHVIPKTIKALKDRRLDHVAWIMKRFPLWKAT